MPDVYAAITEADHALQERLADVIEARAADPRQRAMLEEYLAELAIPARASLLEVGCGTGPVARTLARRAGVGRVLGIDPCALFIDRARVLARGIENLAFEVGDGRRLELASDSIDVVVVHTTLSHVPEPQKLLREALRVLRPGGWLAAFDGDYVTATVATGEFDPLEQCVDAFRASFVHDPWLVRRLPALLDEIGFEPRPLRSHGYVEAQRAGYMASWIDRGADVLCNQGRIGAETARLLKAEAVRRSEQRCWFGHIAFASVLAKKPGAAGDV